MFYKSLQYPQVDHHMIKSFPNVSIHTAVHVFFSYALSSLENTSSGMLWKQWTYWSSDLFVVLVIEPLPSGVGIVGVTSYERTVLGMGNNVPLPIPSFKICSHELVIINYCSYVCKITSLIAKTKTDFLPKCCSTCWGLSSSQWKSRKSDLIISEW